MGNISISFCFWWFVILNYEVCECNLIVYLSVSVFQDDLYNVAKLFSTVNSLEETKYNVCY